MTPLPTDQEVADAFADACFGARQRTRTTQAVLADRVGISRPSVVNWEAGTHGPGLGHAVRAALVLGMSLDEVFGLKPEEAC